MADPCTKISCLLWEAVPGQGQVWGQRQMWRVSASPGVLKDLTQLMVTGCPGLTTAPCQSAAYQEGVAHLGIVTGHLTTALAAAPGKEDSLPVRGMKIGSGKPVSHHRGMGALTEKRQLNSPSCFLLLYLPVAEKATKAKNSGPGEPFISSAGSLWSIKKHYQLAWRKSQQQNQVQINAGRKESFLLLSSRCSPDVQQPQLGSVWGWDRLRFSLIA